MPRVIRVTLTRQMIDTAKPGAAPFRLWDAKVPGLALRVYPSGRRTYEAHWARNKATSLGEAGILTLEGAREAARRVLGEAAQHGAPLAKLKAPEPARLTFREFLDTHYAPYVRASNRAGEATVANLRAQFDALMDQPLASIRRADWDTFKTRRLAQGIHPSTVNRDLDRIKAALTMAREWGLIAANPLQGVKRIKRDIEDRVRYLTPEEESRLRTALAAREAQRRKDRESGDAWRADRGIEPMGAFDAYTDHLMPLVLLALNTGLRRSELTQLRWSDIDLPGRRLKVRAGSAKSGRARYLPLNDEAYTVLDALHSANADGGRLFAVQTFRKAWLGVLTAASIADFRFHDLRHTFASKLVMRGVDLNTVRELLGHGDIKMTLRYAHLAPEHKAAAVRLLDGFVAT